MRIQIAVKNGSTFHDPTDLEELPVPSAKEAGEVGRLVALLHDADGDLVVSVGRVVLEVLLGALQSRDLFL